MLVFSFSFLSKGGRYISPMVFRLWEIKWIFNVKLLSTEYFSVMILFGVKRKIN